MTAPLREPRDWFVGVVEAVTAVSTTMTSDVFTQLPTYWSPTRYLPAEIVDENTGKYEAIRIVGTNGSTTATVVRGVEGTDPQTWDQPTTIRCSPTVRDVLQVYSTGDEVQYADQHVGARYVIAGSNVVREKTAKQGGLPPVRADPRDFYADIKSPTTVSDQSAIPRMKVIPVGPAVTPATGLIEVIWDGHVPAGGPYTWWSIIAGGLGMSVVSAADFVPYLSGADSTWTGNCAVSFIWTPGEQRVTVKFFGANGAVFANRQVRGALVLYGK